MKTLVAAIVIVGALGYAATHTDGITGTKQPVVNPAPAATVGTPDERTKRIGDEFATKLCDATRRLDPNAQCHVEEKR